MTTITEECQLIFYNYKKLEKAEIQRGENRARERGRLKIHGTSIVHLQYIWPTGNIKTEYIKHLSV